MREIFTHIVSFARRQTRPPGFSSFSRTIQRIFVGISVYRKPITLGLFVVLGLFSATHQAHAVVPALLGLGLIGGAAALLYNGQELILKGVNAVLAFCVDIVGSLALVLVDFFMKIIQYNDFLSSSAVANGWVVTRDIANMFFIVILLVIAFGTILGSGEYNTKMLTKLLVMAVVINFSRTIIGIMIDASQIIMLTFVNGFSAAGVGNFINAFGIQKLNQFRESAPAGDLTNLGNIAGALLMGLVLMLVVCSVMITLIGVMLFRIVYLWLLIVLAPIAWLMSTFPAGKKYYAQWWDQFRDQLVVGPAMAFFLWLSLTAVGSGLAWNQVVVKGESLAGVSVALTRITEPESLLSFCVTVIMLLASVQMAQKLAGSANGFSSFMKNYLGAVAKGKKFAKGTAKLADLYQAQATGIQFAKIPKGIKEGFAIRTKKLEESAKKRAAKNAAGLAAVPGGGLVAQYGYNYLANPKMAIEKFANGGFSGIWSRFRQGAVGTERDRRWLVERHAKSEKNAQDKIDDIDKKHKEAEEGLALVDKIQARIDDAKKTKDLMETGWLNDRDVEDTLSTEEFYKYAKAKDLTKAGTFTDFIKSLKTDTGDTTDEAKKMMEHIKSEYGFQSQEFYNYAKESGWTKSESYEEYLVDLTDDKGKPSKMARLMEKKARKEQAALEARARSLEADKAKAQKDLDTNGADWAKITKAYDTENDAEYGKKYRDALKAQVKESGEKRRAGTAAFVMGEMPYRKDLVRGWRDEEKEADNLYDWTKPANVVIDYFHHAGATGEERHQGKALKMVAEKGDLRVLMESEGIRRQDYKNASEWMQAFIDKILIGKYHWDKEYAYSTIAQAGEKESSNGNWDLANHINVDAATGSYEVLTNKKHLEKLSKKFESINVKDLPNKTNHGSLSYKDELGQTHATDELRLMIARLSQDVQGVKYSWDRGEGRANIMKIMVDFQSAIDSNDAIPQALKDSLKNYIKKRPPKSGDSLAKYLEAIQKEWK